MTFWFESRKCFAKSAEKKQSWYTTTPAMYDICTHTYILVLVPYLSSSLLILLDLVDLVVIVIVHAPVAEALAPDPADALAPLGLADGPGVLLVHDARDHEGDDENPDVAAPHGAPPAPLDAHLPQAVDGGAGRGEEEAPALAALEPGPEAGEEAAEEEALRGQDVAGEVLLEEADRGVSLWCD